MTRGSVRACLGRSLRFDWSRPSRRYGFRHSLGWRLVTRRGRQSALCRCWRTLGRAEPWQPDQVWASVKTAMPHLDCIPHAPTAASAAVITQDVTLFVLGGAPGQRAPTSQHPAGAASGGYNKVSGIGRGDPQDDAGTLQPDQEPPGQLRHQTARVLLMPEQDQAPARTPARAGRSRRQPQILAGGRPPRSRPPPRRTRRSGACARRPGRALMFVQSAGCCAGSVPMRFLAGGVPGRRQ